MTVRPTVTGDAGGRVAVGEPKSLHDWRQVELGADLVLMLQAHRTAYLEGRLRLGPAWQDLDVVFDRGDGRPCAPRTVQTACKRLAAAAGVPVLRFHDLRPTGATLMIADGVPAKVISARLGHASISITLGLYAHVQEGMQRNAAAQLEGLLGGAADRARTGQTGEPDEAAS